MKTIILKEANKLLSWKNITKSAAVAFILLMASSSFAIAGALAKTYTAMPPRPTGTYVGVSPTMVGVNQQVLINILTYPAPSGPTFYAQNLAYELTGGFGNISCTIKLPDGSSTTFMPTDFTLQHAGINIPGLAEIVGSLEFYYTPTEVGNYSVTGSFPGQTYTTDQQYANLNLSVLYEASSSAVAGTFMVQSAAIQGGLLNGYPFQPLPFPSAYWTNPVNTNNREWAAISGAWVQPTDNILGNNYNPYTTAPLSPHIVWANTIGSAGLAGGEFGSLAYGDASGGAGNIILDGNIYQNEVGTGYFDCISLRTGQLLWRAPDYSPSTPIVGAQQLSAVGATYQLATQTAEGGISEVLWGGISETLFGAPSSNTWVQYSPYNGVVERVITNVPTDIMQVKYDDANNIFWCIESNYALWNTTIPLEQSYLYLIKWDLSKLVLNSTNLGAAFLVGQDNNWMDGIDWNVSVNSLPGQAVGLGAQDWIDVNPFPFDGAGVVVLKPHNDMTTMAGFSETTGQLLWINNNTALNPDVRDWGMGASPNGPMITEDLATGQFVAYNVQTGQQIWTASAGTIPWSLLSDFCFVYDNGVNYFGSYDGHVYAYNSNTGALVWQSSYTGNSTETIYGDQPFNGASVGGGGVLYYSTSTTYSLEPRTRFHGLYAINQTTGDFLWYLPIDMNPDAIAYGYLVSTDVENGIQYVIGQGQTATTVTTMTSSVTSGTPLTIQGTVMDESPGMLTNGVASNPTPAISDANMSVWMDYLYGQNATLINSPPDCNGVPVTLTAVGPSGTAVTIGTTTSDGDGHFAMTWNPTTTGLYTIYATFAGSNSYYSSYGETSVTVAAASTTTPTGTPTPTSTAASSASSNTSLLYGILVAVIIAIIIGLAALVFTLRRK